MVAVVWWWWWRRRVRVCVRACACARACVRGGGGMCVRARVMWCDVVWHHGGLVVGACVAVVVVCACVRARVMWCDAAWRGGGGG